MPTQKQMQAYLANVRKKVKEYGWIVNGVFPVDKAEVGFAYTVGLTEAGLPELVISGGFGEQAQVLLNAAGALHVGDGTQIKHGDTIESIANVSFRAIDAPVAEVNTARRLYGYARVRAVQLVWPDVNGLWPGSAFTSGKTRQELFGVPWW